MTNRMKSPFATRRASLALERLEDRVTPSWAGTPPAQITPPSDALVVTLDSQTGDASGTGYNYYGENDFVRFTTTVAGSYTFRSSTPNSRMDTVIGVFSATGARLGFNDDISSTNTDSQLTLTSPTLSANQTYYLGITRYTGGYGGAYTWSIDGPSPSAPPGPTDDTYEENDTRAQASDLGTVTQAKTVNNLVMADANDWYRFTTTSTGDVNSAVSISFLNSQGNLNLELVSSTGTVLGQSTTTNNSERVTLSGRAAGTYYVHVYGAAGATNPSYSLTVTPSASTTPPPTGGFNIQIVFTGGLTASQQAVFTQAAARWERIILGDLPNATYNGQTVDDVRIDASGASIDGPGGVLGEAGPDRFRTGSSLPYHGTMQFDSADLASMQSSGQLLDVITHEMGHVLGIGTIWTTRGLLAGAGTSNPRFTGAQATAAYNAIFHTSATGVPVENSGGSGTRDSHWRESVFGAELMTGYINSGQNPLSRVTVASLADLGYQVDMNAAEAYTPPGSSPSPTGGSSSRPALQAGSPSGGPRLTSGFSANLTVADLALLTGLASDFAGTPAPAQDQGTDGPIVSGLTGSVSVGTSQGTGGQSSSLTQTSGEQTDHPADDLFAIGLTSFGLGG